MLVRCHRELLLLLCLCFIVHYGDCSAGDRSYVYQRCLRRCAEKNCSHISDKDYQLTQSWYMNLLQWDCNSECGYTCMWTAVDAFQKDGQKIPQFYGKWPFLRFLGIQEPASVVFSVLNGLSHAICLYRFKKEVESTTPMYYVWQFYAVVGVNAWLWSSIFHSRDFPFTEKMDYFCAISLVLSSVFVLCARVIGTDEILKLAGCFIGLLAFFVYHVHYLAFIKFDYGYNMTANITVGILNSLCWLWWCTRHRHEQPYVWKAVVSIVAIHLLLLLEVNDFPPVGWIFDAHSLWHAGTAPVGFLWYSFVKDDTKFIMSKLKFKKEI